jgi:hypothetical protein
VTDKDVHEQPTNPDPIAQGDLEKELQASGVPSLASELKRFDPTARMAVTSGHKDYAVDAVGGPAADYLMFYAIHGQNWTPVAIPRHVPPRPVLAAPNLTAVAPRLAPGDQDSLAVQLALSCFRQTHPRITVINLPEFDWPLGHLRGGAADSYDAWRLTARLDADIGAIQDELQSEHLLGETAFVLTADHGMLTLNHTIPHEFFQQAVHDAGTGFDDYDYHSAAYFWVHDHAKIPAVAASIVRRHNPLIRAVYYRMPGSTQYTRVSDIHLLASAAVDRAYQCLLSTMSGPHAPHVAVFLRENTAVVGRNEVGWRGDHGGPSWHAEHIPLILSGVGIKKGVHSSYPATLYDVAPTILSLLGATPSDMDGIPLADALTNTDDASAATQDKSAAELQPLVDALIQQSKQDGS